MKRFTAIIDAILVFACQSAFGYTLDWTANCLSQYTEFTHDADGNMTQCGDWTANCLSQYTKFTYAA